MLGYLTSIFLSDYEMDIFGFCSATKTRIIVMLLQKQNLENYNEQVLKTVRRFEYNNVSSSKLFMMLT
jgi:hypothetical protein